MAVFTSKGNGGWDQAGQTTWNEVGVPGAGDDVEIEHNIFLESATQCRDLSLDRNSLDTTDGTDWPLIITGDLVIDGQLVFNTSLVQLGGDLSGNGSINPGTGELDMNGAGAQSISDMFTVYDLTNSNTGGVVTVADSAVFTVQNQITNNVSAIILLSGVGDDTELNMGTAGSAGIFANAGEFRAHANSGAFATFIQGVNPGFFANLNGAGIYDWDYGTNNGRVFMAYLKHNGTHASAQTTGGGGVTIELENTISFLRDFTVDPGDVWVDEGNEILASATVAVQKLDNITGGDLTIDGTQQVNLDGICSFSGAITWSGSTSTVVPFDASSVINATGGVTIPGGTRFGADAGGLMGNGNPVSDWVTAQSWGWFNNSGTTTLPREVLILTSQSGGNCMVNSGTLIHNNCILTPTSTTAHQTISNASNDDLYRLDNQNTFVATISFAHDTDLDGIFFNENTITEAENGVTVTLTGLTPALGSVGPFTHDELEDTGRLLETGTGLFVFDFEVAEDVGPGNYRVTYTTADTEQSNLVDVWFKDAMDRYSKEAEILIDDPDGSQAANYTTGDPVRIMYHNGVEWVTRWRGFADDIDDGERQSPFGRIRCYGFDMWFRKRKVNATFTHKDHTIKQILKVLIEKFSPVTFDVALIDLDTDVSGLRPTFQAVTLDEAISQMLDLSDNEEYFVDDDFQFNVRQRATSYDGTYNAPVLYTEDNITSADLETMGSDEVNRVVVYYDTNLDKLTVAEDTTRQTDLQTTTGASQPVIVEVEYSRPDIKDATEAQAYADFRLNAGKTYLKGTIETYDSENVLPGMITRVTLTDKSDYAAPVDFKVLETTYHKTQDLTVLLLVEPALDKPRFNPLGVNNRMDNVQKNSEKTDTQRSDNSFEQQEKSWTNMADFNLFALGGNQQVLESGAINCSGATAGVETTTGPWVVPGTEKDFVFFWAYVLWIATQNDGTLLVYVEGSVTGDVLMTEDWQDIRDSFLNTEDTRIKLTFDWNGAGTSPVFEYGLIGWK